MSKDQLWKIVFSHTNRPKKFSRLFQAGKWLNFFPYFSRFNRDPEI